MADKPTAMAILPADERTPEMKSATQNSDEGATTIGHESNSTFAQSLPMA